MTLDFYCEIGISFEKVKQFSNLWSQTEFIRDTEEKVRLYMQDYGEILEFKNELVDKTIYKVHCKLNVFRELVGQFEKWGEVEFARMMDRELRLNFIDLGEILDFKNHLDYTRDESIRDGNRARENKPVKSQRMKFLKIIALLIILGALFGTFAYQARYGKIEHSPWGAYHG